MHKAKPGDQAPELFEQPIFVQSVTDANVGSGSEAMDKTHVVGYERMLSVSHSILQESSVGSIVLCLNYVIWESLSFIMRNNMAVEISPSFDHLNQCPRPKTRVSLPTKGRVLSLSSSVIFSTFFIQGWLFKHR